MCLNGSLEGMWFELQPGTSYIKHASLFEFLYIRNCRGEALVPWDTTPRHWTVGCRSFESTFPSLKMGPIILHVMLLKDYRTVGAWSRLLWHAHGWLETEVAFVTNYAVERRLAALLALKMKLLLSFETQVTLYYSTRWNFPQDLNIQQHCRQNLISRVCFTECCNTTEFLSIFAFQSKRISIIAFLVDVW